MKKVYYQDRQGNTKSKVEKDDLTKLNENCDSEAKSIAKVESLSTSKAKSTTSKAKPKAKAAANASESSPSTTTAQEPSSKVADTKEEKAVLRDAAKQQDKVSGPKQVSCFSGHALKRQSSCFPCGGSKKPCNVCEDMPMRYECSQNCNYGICVECYKAATGGKKDSLEGLIAAASRASPGDNVEQLRQELTQKLQVQESLVGKDDELVKRGYMQLAQLKKMEHPKLEKKIESLAEKPGKSDPKAAYAELAQALDQATASGLQGSAMIKGNRKINGIQLEAFQASASQGKQAVGDTNAAYSAYSSKAAMQGVLEKGDVVLVKSQWLAEVFASGKALPRRQELPDSAFWQVSEKPWEKLVVAVSHSWAKPDHPDPQSDHLKPFLAPALKKFNEQRGEAAVFLDWCSLPQLPRSPQDEKRFERALEQSPLWFCHSDTIVLLITGAKSGDRCHKARAWPWFESAVSSFKDSKTVFDIATQSADGLDFTKPSITVKQPHVDVENFGITLATKDCKFRMDKLLLTRLYAGIFEVFIGSRKEISLKRSKWDTSHLVTFSKCLPTCLNLEVLILSENQIDDCSCLASYLSSNGSLRMLNLELNKLTNLSGLVDAFKQNTRLERLYMSCNAITDASAIEGLLKKESKLEFLDLVRNKIPAAQKAKIKDMWNQAGKPKKDQLKL